MKIRNPKAEVRKKPEGRGQQQVRYRIQFSEFVIRISFGFRISNFGF
jgi:hypothetical protein